jgi:CheY-like chemotaxis protein
VEEAMRMIRILIVEDDPLKARTIYRAIGAALQDVFSVAIGQAANLQDANAWLDQCQARCDLVICDWSFPRKPGESEIVGTGREIVERCQAWFTPVLIISGETVEEDLRRIWLTDYRVETLRRMALESISPNRLPYTTADGDVSPSIKEG